MSSARSKLQSVLYPVFLVSCVTGSVLGLLLIWCIEGNLFLGRIVATCAVLTVATAFTMSATRLVTGPPPEDDRGDTRRA